MQTYRFDDFELDLDALQLRLRGEPVKFERRPLDLLILLVSRHGRLVPRGEIIAAL
jgi:DNA-binding winged helix-turn-helix (wHTH) protein